MPPSSKLRSGILIWMTIPVLVIFIFLASTKPKSPTKVKENRKIYIPKKPIWKLGENPPPQKLSNSSANEKLYVMIIDSEYESNPYHCIMKNQWVDKFIKNPKVDGVEMYSVNAWTNQECNLSSITIPEIPKQKINPSAYLLYNALSMTLNRTDAGWIFIIGDAAYIHVDRFFEWVSRIMNSHNPEYEIFMTGSCVEERYFFQMLLTSSGILISRKFAENLVKSGSDSLWDVSYSVGITSDEILAKISDKLGQYIPGTQTSVLVGRGFTDKLHYELLTEKQFDSLPKCKIPEEYLNSVPGELSLCISQILKFNQIISWSGTYQIGKLEFLKNAEKMMNNNPDDLGYYWDRLYLALCKL